MTILDFHNKVREAAAPDTYSLAHVETDVNGVITYKAYSPKSAWLSFPTTEMCIEGIKSANKPVETQENIHIESDGTPQEKNTLDYICDGETLMFTSDEVAIRHCEKVGIQECIRDGETIYNKLPF